MNRRSKILALVIVLDVLTAIYSIVGIFIFGQVWSLLGLLVDLRWMLFFVGLSVFGSVILTVSFYRDINPLWALVGFIPSLCVALFWVFECVLDSGLGAVGTAIVGLPVVIYAFGCALSIYKKNTTVRDER